MSILPIKILVPNKRKFQEISLLIDRPEFEKEIVKLIRKWRNKSPKETETQYQRALRASLKKLKLPTSFYELLSDCVRFGTLWKNYDLSLLGLMRFLEVLDESRKSKTLVILERDRDWYWRNRNGEGYGKIAQKDRVERHTVIEAVKRYKRMTGNR
ncbi:MAG: hypothetical protein A3H50_03510 [Candidatus Levybacteria bacterium RIFCSPLOWO2_02_FULL_37_10]|uniref:Uncharacterized protein n=1 Tax=Candidatus Wildermuthbacteria bacterium RIFCSPHIGHO2_12_FULL_40_12 TaxID=1802457 RepID=A0A1G2RFC4_9BACT|nr:MAG: hypothetical protein A2860_02415 [Candidatus Levybacteria bacterium RIFCSPHIGHO2_01_FULL_37_33]OGH15810.1 MAG: hypothetical protein A3C97_01020 [Candidatus Levybacteria bacterium RIFCSPHIGHO2_02_FULL_37_11]OGH43125.1 MAG: hypothetical protein A3H50_03510 [Candidatus Levybacteria bacterium RIFCSPLOWO2_02_FULL_37_10]OHA70972.1 MAG: hypothetical protein A3F15_00295 [Candidatus Wildermuthbacteria bacterium RIFCSPHIGHO2_12_FULL_40_12]